MVASVYITHPEVVIDPDVPTPQWGLSEIGKARAKALADRQLFAPGTIFVSSEERKALDLGEILSAGCGGTLLSYTDLGENDRSSTGYMTPAAFEAQVDKLFGDPDKSASGWETANAAQKRIVAATTLALKDHTSPNPVVFLGHGCVGTLLLCHVSNRKIARREDQRKVAHPGGGNVFAFDLAQSKLLCDWTPMEDWTGLDQ